MSKIKLNILFIFIVLFSSMLSQNMDSLWKFEAKAFAEANYEAAIKYATQIKELSEKRNDKENLIKSLLELSTAYQNKGDFSDAQTVSLQALKTAETLKNKKLLAKVYIELGNVCYSTQNTNNALKYFNLSLETGLALDSKEIIIWSYTNLGNIYDEFLNDTVHAIQYYNSSLKIAQEINKKDDEAIALNNIGSVYLKSNVNKALPYLIRSAEIHNKLGNTYNVAISYVNIADVYSQQKNYAKAAQYLDKSMELGKQSGAKEIVQEVYRLRYLLDSLKNDYASVFKNYKLYKLYGDSIENVESEKRLLREQMQYDFDKKEIIAKEEQEKKDAIAAFEARRQRIVLIFVSCFLVLVALLAVVIFRSLRVNQEKNKIITAQKQEVETQKQLVEEKHKEITDSINYAERIQKSFLAIKETLDKNLTEYFVLFRPKDVVSGDFYWAENLANGNFILATADSTGHGVPGAIMSLLNITSLEKAIENNSQPAEILNHTRKTIISRLKRDGSPEGGKDGMDCTLSVYDFKNNKLHISAANNPVWIVRGMEVIEIKPDKIPVGKHDRQNIPFTQHEIDLQKGDVIYTLTDGFADQFGGEKNKKFMSKKLRELLALNAHLPMQQQKKILEKAFTNWIGINEQVDDVTVIGVRI